MRKVSEIRVTAARARMERWTEKEEEEEGLGFPPAIDGRAKERSSGE